MYCTKGVIREQKMPRVPGDKRWQGCQGTKGAKGAWVKSSEGLLGGRVFLRTYFRLSFTLTLLEKFRDKTRKEKIFLPHPCMYFGEYLCICIMTDVGHQTCHLHLPWSTIFWSFWHNINSQSDQTKMYVNIFRLGGNIFCGYIDYFPWNTQLSPCMWWILIRV